MGGGGGDGEQIDRTKVHRFTCEMVRKRDEMILFFVHFLWWLHPCGCIHVIASMWLHPCDCIHV